MEITATNTEGVIAQNTISNDSALTITFTSSEETEDLQSMISPSLEELLVTFPLPVLQFTRLLLPHQLMGLPLLA